MMEETINLKDLESHDVHFFTSLKEGSLIGIILCLYLADTRSCLGHDVFCTKDH